MKKTSTHASSKLCTEKGDCIQRYFLHNDHVNILDVKPEYGLVCWEGASFLIYLKN